MRSLILGAGFSDEESDALIGEMHQLLGWFLILFGASVCFFYVWRMYGEVLRKKMEEALVPLLGACVSYLLVALFVLPDSFYLYLIDKGRSYQLLGFSLILFGACVCFFYVWRMYGEVLRRKMEEVLVLLLPGASILCVGCLLIAMFVFARAAPGRLRRGRDSFYLYLTRTSGYVYVRDQLEAFASILDKMYVLPFIRTFWRLCEFLLTFELSGVGCLFFWFSVPYALLGLAFPVAFFPPLGIAVAVIYYFLFRYLCC